LKKIIFKSSDVFFLEKAVLFNLTDILSQFFELDLKVILLLILSQTLLGFV